MMQEQSIFVEALDKEDPAERAAFLARVCASDFALRQRIERLLQRHQQADDFLDTPASGQVGTVDQPLTERPGAVIGPYKLLQQIGEGGMGVVYMAEQQQPIRRRVALKIIKPGMDSAQVIARFEAERQALALMDHQNIAKVHDGGTTESGRPYFVMELVHGVPVTQYCDDHHLTPKERLELFLPVCHAVQHAHQKGIIHRDLKPSNVLVCLYDGVAVPKVIDFGVAKATGQSLTERTMFTQFGSLVGTLEYMSPEQAEMSQLGIDTRSDVYSMGVMLYELLTGTTPLERHRLREAGFDEIRRLIREEEPPKPSTRLSASGVALAAISAQRQTEPAKLTKLVRGELDWIVMKALEKDRNRRYESANGLARDVERYLHDEPVEACPPTAGYKLRKFARKHKAGLATAVGFAVLLLLGVAGSTWQAVLAQANENKANAHAAQAEQKEQEAKNERDQVRALNARLQDTLYAAHMNLAQHAWEAGGIGRMVELLEQHRPKPGETDLRAFEWHYLNRLCHTELLTLKIWSPFSVAFSPDGKRLVSSGHGGLKVWDAQSGQELRFFKDVTSNAVFSPDGKRLASPGKVWDAQTGQELLTLEGGGINVAYSPAGKRLASTGDGALKVWDAQTGKELLSLKVRSGFSCPDSRLTFSPDSKRLAYALGTWDDTKKVEVEDEVKVCDAQTGQELLAFKFDVSSLAFSPDGKRLAGAADKTVKVWDAQTGEELLTLKGASSLAFSPDGKCLAGGQGNGWVNVWDARTGQELFSLKGHTINVNSVAYSPDGKRLASAGWEGTVKVWDAQPEPKPLTLRGAAVSSVASVAFSPDGKRLASGGSGRPGSGPGALKVWDIQTGRDLLTLQGHASNVTTVAFSPDGKRLASGSDDKTLRVWDAQTGQELLTLKGHTGEIKSVTYSPDGRRLASGSYDNSVKVWDAHAGQELLKLKGFNIEVNSVTYSPDGKRLASGGGQVIPGHPSPVTLRVCDAQTGRELLGLEAPFWVTSVAFSPDGSRLASAGGFMDPGPVRVWDMHNGKQLLTCRGHSSEVKSVAFSPDGKRLASASEDNTVKVWDVQTGNELLTFKGSVRSVAFSPNGYWLAGGADDGTVTIWDATPLPEKP
jgi:WD40 repeat protein/serine/threonine protein kinase